MGQFKKTVLLKYLLAGSVCLLIVEVYKIWRLVLVSQTEISRVHRHFELLLENKTNVRRLRIRQFLIVSPIETHCHFTETVSMKISEVMSDFQIKSVTEINNKSAQVQTK